MTMFPSLRILDFRGQQKIVQSFEVSDDLVPESSEDFGTLSGMRRHVEV